MGGVDFQCGCSNTFDEVSDRLLSQSWCAEHAPSSPVSRIRKKSENHITVYEKPVHKLADFKFFGKSGYKERTQLVVCGGAMFSAAPRYNWSRHWRHVDCPKCLEYRAPRAYKFWREEKREQLESRDSLPS